MNAQLLEYDLYLDESGDFMEVSRVDKERQRSKTRKRGAQSQLVGLLVPRESDAAQEARTITDAAKSKGRLPPKEHIHATNILKKQSRYQYQEVAEAIIRGVERHTEWQPVRLINLEEVPYHDRPSIYANLVAELILRVFEAKSKALPEAKICIRLIDPSYMIDEPGDPVLHKLKAEEYNKRINEYLGFATVRYGLTVQQQRWRFDGIIGKPYRETDAMQICDVLSNASYNNFENLQRQSMKAALRKLFGDYDFTLTIRELFERVDELTKEHSFGMAIMILAESLVHAPHATKQDQEFAAKLEERLNHIVGRLGRMDFRGRDPQLALLIGWLDQLVGQQRLLDKGYEIAHWLLEHVEAPLRTQLGLPRDEATLDWFAYSVRRWALTACNHKGALLLAEAEVNAMNSLQASLAREWERAPLLMDGFIAQAVHYTDCFEFDKASARMKFVAESLKTQSTLFHELMPGDFPEFLKFDLRARALGTLVQSETLGGAGNAVRLNGAREASEEAVLEFTSFSDRARQYQYRCHLETVNADFATARRFLTKSLDPSDAEPVDFSHKRIGELITDLTHDPEWKVEFTLLHWLRIGAAASLDENEREGEQFMAALDSSGQLESIACQGRISHYPVHSILRFVAVIQAARGRWDNSLTALQRLQALDPIGKEQFVLAMILMAAQAEVAGLLWPTDDRGAYQLLDHMGHGLSGQSKDSEGIVGLKQLLSIMRVAEFPRAVGLIDSWQAKINSLLCGDVRSDSAKQDLLEIGSTVPY